MPDDVTRKPEHDVPQALAKIRQQLNTFEERYQRPINEVTLLAVSKTKPVDLLLDAIAAGQTEFGENYLDEALLKIDALRDYSLTWHFIGAIQSNKTAAIARSFDWVHSIDREKIARRLSDQRPDHLSPLNCCIQLNIDQEDTKAGTLPAELGDLCAIMNELPGVSLRGLMAIPAPRDSMPEQREIFARIRTELEKLQSSYDSIDTLSMGMSSDLEAAVAEGSTMVRVGTALFGRRD